MVHRDLAAFGKAVRQYRQRASLSQEALAERSGLHHTYVSGIERGQRNVGLVNVYRLVDGLGLTAAELFATADPFRRRGARSTRDRTEQGPGR